MALKVPLIPTAAISEFGDLRESSAFNDPQVMDQDTSYVPGFSEMRRTHDIQKAEYLRGERTWDSVLKLPVNLRWARCQDKAGTPDSTKVFRAGTKGYVPVNGHTIEKGGDSGNDWLTAMPPGCVLGPDGSIRRGDVQLMVCSKEDAARSEIAKRARTDAQLGNAESIFAQNLGTANTKGLDPEVAKLSQGQGVFEKGSKKK